MTVMEKVLLPAVVNRYAQGDDRVNGYCTRASDFTGATPAERVTALNLTGALWPFGTDPDHVDVVRFDARPAMNLATPAESPATEQRPWPAYPTGLTTTAAPVWELELTRLPAGATIVRISADGTEETLTTYAGAALGWHNTRDYRPPTELVGPRAVFQGHDLPASWSADGTSLDLIWLGDRAPAVFGPTRHAGVWAVNVTPADCDKVFEVVITATHQDQPVRILQQAGTETLVQLLDPTMEAINNLHATALDTNLFQAIVDTNILTNTTGRENLATPTP